MDMITKLASDTLYPVATIALGTFDGVHAGHQRIIRRAAEIAGAKGHRSLVFTSANHPLSVLAPQRCPRLITPGMRKAELIRELGVDSLCMIPFTPEFLKLTPEQFVVMLRERFAPGHIVVGPNYTFGHKGAGTVETLKLLGERHGFAVEVPEALNQDGVMVSSTVIRRLIAEGSLAAAARMLTRSVSLRGHVDSFENNRLRPTYAKAIIEGEPGQAVPADGVYHVSLTVDYSRHSGLARLSTAMPEAGGAPKLEIQFLSGHSYWDEPLNGRVAYLEFADPAAGLLPAVAEQ